MKLAETTASWFAHPASILLFPPACFAYLWFGGSVNGLTLILSILAITITQLVLYVGGKRDTAMHKKIDELVKAVPDADNTLIGIEQNED